MTEYFGLQAIADRTGWRDKRTPVNAMARDCFFMFKRHRAGYPREMWYCNAQLIRAGDAARVRRNEYSHAAGVRGYTRLRASP